MGVARVAHVGNGCLYANLRELLEPSVELVDLGGMDLAAVAKTMPDVDVVLHHPSMPLPPESLTGDRLRALLAPGAGYDGIPIAAATERGILATNQAGCNAEGVAEHALGLMLAVAKRIGEGDRLIRGGHEWHAGMFWNHEIRGLTLGVVGLGHIGRQLADIAHTGFAMSVLGFDPYASEVGAHIEVTTLDDLLRRSDLISIHVPLVDETRNLIGRREIALIKPNAIVVNTARGHILDLDALADALAHDRLRGAGLDVFDDDKLDLDHPLMTLDTVVLTPHIAGATLESIGSQAVRQADTVRAVLEGRIPDTANVLNPDAQARFLERFGS